MTRNEIVQGLLTWLTPSGVFQTVGRRVPPWNEVKAQPALFLRHVKDHYTRGPTRMPPKLTIECECWIYSNAGSDPLVAPDVALNDLLDQVEQQLCPPAGREAQTLDGIVAHAWIEGAIEMYPGDLNGQAIAVVPIMVLVPTLGG